MSLPTYFILLLVTYLLYTKVVKQWLRWWYFTKQGMATFGFPVPFLGNIPQLLKLDLKSPYARGVLLELLNTMYPNYELPPAVFGFFQIDGVVILNDPELAQDCYVKNNRVLSKYHRIKSIMFQWLGDGLILLESNELWAQKRKHLSTALYKDKTTRMINNIVELSARTVNDWKTQYAGKDKFFNMIRTPSDLVADSVLQTIFGMESKTSLIANYKNGVRRELSLSNCLRDTFLSEGIHRQFAVYRLIFPMFD